MITLTLKRKAKNGMVSYGVDRKRTSGTVYFDKKCFADSEPPQTLTLDAAGFHLAAANEPAASPSTDAAGDQAVNEAATAE